jgi:hypothetical protein
MRQLRANRKIGWSLVLIATVILSLGVILTGRRRMSHEARDRTEIENHLSALPHVIIWAWERPERLDFIDPDKVGVAFLAKTLYLRGEKVVARPRLQPLDIPSATSLIAVARIETDRSQPASLSNVQAESAASEIAKLARMPGVVSVQIDFHARTSEHLFYSSVLARVRKSLPESTGLSITALASWCKGDNWISNLPVDEAVPMLFRMGADRAHIVSSLASGGNFNSCLCQQSVGISTDEQLSSLPATQRIYVFNPKAWSLASVQKIMEHDKR